jgi:antitoxin VapB
MATSTVRNRGHIQTIRLSKVVAFPGDVQRVDILKIGSARVLVPTGNRWGDLFDRGPRASKDFMESGGAVDPD